MKSPCKCLLVEQGTIHFDTRCKYRSTVSTLSCLLLAVLTGCDPFGHEEALRRAKKYGHVRQDKENALIVAIDSQEGADELIPHLKNLPELYDVAVTKVDLSEPHLETLGLVDTIEILILRSCQIEDDDVRFLVDLPKLRRLDLSNNPITDNGLQVLGGVSSLEELEVHNTQIVGHGLSYLNDLPKLRKIGIRGVEFDDAALAQSSLPTKLEALSFTSTKTTPDGFMQLADYHWLHDISVPNGVLSQLTDDTQSDVRKFMLKFNQAHRESYEQARDAGEEVPNEYIAPFNPR